MPVIFKSIAVATLTAGGTAQKVTATSAAACKAYVCCPSGNTANIWIGDASVSATGKRGLEVVKGTTVAIMNDDNDIFDLSGIYFDGTTGDKASVTYLVDPAG